MNLPTGIFFNVAKLGKLYVIDTFLFGNFFLIDTFISKGQQLLINNWTNNALYFCSGMASNGIQRLNSGIFSNLPKLWML